MPTSVRTGYIYDGDDHVVEQVAYVGGGEANQHTAFDYGVGTSNGSGIFSNDLLYEIRYANLVTGLPSTSSSQQETYAYDVSGEQIYSKNRNGTTHLYAYDSLGRMTADRATTLGSGVADASAGGGLGRKEDPSGIGVGLAIFARREMSGSAVGFLEAWLRHPQWREGLAGGCWVALSPRLWIAADA